MCRLVLRITTKANQVIVNVDGSTLIIRRHDVVGRDVVARRLWSRVGRGMRRHLAFHKAGLEVRKTRDVGDEGKAELDPPGIPAAGEACPATTGRKGPATDPECRDWRRTFSTL